MKIYQPKTTYLDRLLPQTESGPKREARFLNFLEKKLALLSFLEKSFFLKEPRATTALLKIDWVKFKASKALLSFGGALSSLGLLLLSPNLHAPIFWLIPPLTFLVAFSLPDLYLSDKEHARHFKIHAQLPNLLDLLSLYTASAAYEGFGQALQTISQTMSGVMGEELKELTARYPFIGLEEFLEALEKRFPEQAVRELTATIRLTEKYGGSLAQKIALLAEEAHKARLQRARELGQKSSLALLVPLLIFHLPVALIIFLAPLVLSLRMFFNP